MVAHHWPDAIERDRIGDPALVAQVEAARLALLTAMGFERD